MTDELHSLDLKIDGTPLTPLNFDQGVVTQDIYSLSSRVPQRIVTDRYLEITLDYEEYERNHMDVGMRMEVTYESSHYLTQVTDVRMEDNPGHHRLAHITATVIEEYTISPLGS